MKKSRNPGGKGENGQHLWQRVTRSVKAYAPAAATKPPSPKKAPVTPQPRKIPPRKAPPIAADATPAPAPKGFDRSTETKLRRGQLPLEGRLDLHGMTQQEAFAALHRFIRSAIAQKKRTVLIVTGKGLRSEGVLKRLVPLWLQEPELGQYLLALTPAQPKDGGSGAFYLRLRKPQ